MKIIQIGIWLFYATLALLVAIGALMWIADSWIRDDDARRERLEVQGFIRKMPALKKEYPTLQDCVVRNERLMCPYTVKGELKWIEAK